MKFKALFFCIYLLAAGWCFHRDVYLEKCYSSDLRNRIVGARLEEDGVSPYFYKWKISDGMRYYDPATMDNYKFSGITASPFFHHLLYPVANWQQRTISYLWLFMEYVALLITTLIVLSFAKNTIQQYAVLSIAILFLFTEAWKTHIRLGQLYIFIPMLAAIFYWLINKKQKLLHAVCAGFVCITLILIRPNAILFFLPLAFFFNRFSRNYLVCFFLPVVLLCSYSVINSTERNLWTDYYKNIKMQIANYQGYPVEKVNTDKDPGYATIEGFNMAAVKKLQSSGKCTLYSEDGNFFVVFKAILKKTISLPVMNALCLVCIAVLLVLFIKHKNGIDLLQAALLGYTLMMITDLFSPVYRHQYATVQWLFPVMLITAFVGQRINWKYFVLFLGIALNIVNIEFIKMEHTIGEYLLLFAVLFFSFDKDLMHKKGERI
ncbi:glycosyltransferase 87 family protein [Ferruginibacter albus]|uniref:glycosyltransferase 87 family protein n=1 Tax=Ferruginibacter albus TaxID=2875540 RepID=UPI001CC4239E|nr:glycosyltransferase 87 family protein [Ferruginibacter albus]UAY52606.1 glycosyltransferase 87 family protein [Ferruginibacter albus]